MRMLTIQEVIKALPIDKAIKSEILANYHNYDTIRQFEISHICWNAFEKMKKAMEELTYQRFIAEIAEGKRPGSPDLRQEAADAVWQEIEDMISGKFEEKKQLEEVRKQLEALVRKQ